MVCSLLQEQQVQLQQQLAEVETMRQEVVHLGVQVQRLPQLYQELEQLKSEAAEADKVRAQVAQLQEGVQQLDGLRLEQQLLQQQVEQVRQGMCWLVVCMDCCAFVQDAVTRHHTRHVICTRVLHCCCTVQAHDTALAWWQT